MELRINFLQGRYVKSSSINISKKTEKSQLKSLDNEPFRFHFRNYYFFSLHKCEMNDVILFLQF